jgi:hypothetical protein
MEDQVLSSERMSVFALIGWTDEQLSMSPRCERFFNSGPVYRCQRCQSAGLDYQGKHGCENGGGGTEIGLFKAAA